MALSLKQDRSLNRDIAMHVDRGSSGQLAMTSDTDMWSPFAIDAKGGEMKTKGEMMTKWEHAHRGSMSCCHQ